MENEDEDLPVAVPIFRRRRRRILGMFLRGGRGREEQDEEEQQEALEEAMALPPGAAAAAAAAAEAAATLTATAHRVAPASPFLFDLVREGLPCNVVLAGSQVRGCDQVVKHCQNVAPDDVQYLCPRTGRTPLHEAALRGACLHIIQAIMEQDVSRSMHLDHSQNTPLHLFFLAGLTVRRLDAARVDATVQQLLRPHPLAVALLSNREGSLPLHCACSAPESMVPAIAVERLVEANPASASRVNSHHQTPLHLHCQRRLASTEVAQLLINACPEAVRSLDHPSTAAAHNQDNNNHHSIVGAGGGGCTPLHYAAASSNYPLVQLLVQADPRAANLRTTPTGRTALHLICQRHPTASAALPAIRTLLEAAPEMASQPDSVGAWTPLHWLCRGAATGSSGNAGGGGGGGGAGMQATSRNMIDLEILQALIEAAPAALQTTDRNLYLPLHCACEAGAPPEVISILLQAYPAAARALTRKNDTALSLACTANQSTETVQSLLAIHPEATLQANDYGMLPLHCACRSFQPKAAIVQALVDAKPETVLLQTHAGESPVHLAGSNTGSTVAVIEVLTRAYQTLQRQQGRQPHQQQEGQDEGTEEVDPSAIERGNDRPRQDRDGDAEAANMDMANSGNSGTTSNALATVSAGQMVVARDLPAMIPAARVQTSKVGNTPLHYACFRSFSQEHIEALAEAHPEWITVRNNAGYSPLQILCKNGRIDERTITLFSRICGASIFASVDLMGNTPLHSAMREETSVDALRALIRAYPEALNMKTTYEDTPLHLACLRRLNPDVVREVAKASSLGVVSPSMLASCNGRLSPLLEQNTAGQTPIGIASEDFQKFCQGNSSTCCVRGDYTVDQNRSFEVLASLVKLLHYGPLDESGSDTSDESLLRACIALHRKDARLDPAFIRRALHLYPEEARLKDDQGNTPLHIEASIPIEKMSLLDGAARERGCCDGACHRRLGVLQSLLEVYPEATKQRNARGDFPLGLMIQNGRKWDGAFALAVQTYPQALNWVKDLSGQLTPRVFARVSDQCGVETIYGLIRSRPALVAVDSGVQAAESK